MTINDQDIVSGNNEVSAIVNKSVSILHIMGNDDFIFEKEIEMIRVLMRYHFINFTNLHTSSIHNYKYF